MIFIKSQITVGYWLRLGNSVAPSDGFRADLEEDERLVIGKMAEYVKRGEGMKVHTDTHTLMHVTFVYY